MTFKASVGRGCVAGASESEGRALEVRQEQVHAPHLADEAKLGICSLKTLRKEGNISFSSPERKCTWHTACLLFARR